MVRQYLSIYGVTAVIEELLILAGGERYFPTAGCPYAMGLVHAVWIAALVNVIFRQMQKIYALEKENKALDQELKADKERLKGTSDTISQ